MLLCRCLVVFALSTSPSGVNVASLKQGIFTSEIGGKMVWVDNYCVFFTPKNFAHLLNGWTLNFLGGWKFEQVRFCTFLEIWPSLFSLVNHCTSRFDDCKAFVCSLSWVGFDENSGRRSLKLVTESKNFWNIKIARNKKTTKRLWKEPKCKTEQQFWRYFHWRNKQESTPLSVRTFFSTNPSKVGLQMNMLWRNHPNHLIS